VKKYAVYSGSTGRLGSVTIGEDVVVSAGGKTARFPPRYAESVILGKTLPLGKVEVKLSYYDLLGSKSEFDFAMSEGDARALKHLLGK